MITHGAAFLFAQSAPHMYQEVLSHAERTRQTVCPAGHRGPHLPELVRQGVFPYSGRQMVKRNFEDLANELLKIGFTEIFTLPLKDLSTGWMKKEYAVQNVVIEGVDAIKKGMILDYDKKITIQYHSFK